MLNRTVYVHVSVIAALRSVVRAAWMQASIGSHHDVREHSMLHMALHDLPDHVSGNDLAYRLPEEVIPCLSEIRDECAAAIMEFAPVDRALYGVIFIDDEDDYAAPSSEVEAFLRAERG